VISFASSSMKRLLVCVMCASRALPVPCTHYGACGWTNQGGGFAADAASIATRIRCRIVHQRSGMIMTEQDLHLESERLIEEARLEIEAIKEALEASREKPALVDMTESSHST